VPRMRHSYLTYLRDRLTAMRDLLTVSGSIFVQIGDENAHRIRVLLDEVFGEDNLIAVIGIVKTSGLQSGSSLPHVIDYILQYGKDSEITKFRPLYVQKREETNSISEYFYLELSNGSVRSMTLEEKEGDVLVPEGARPFSLVSVAKGKIA
jgi:adenine-specific DNA-methyltransferase